MYNCNLRLYFIGEQNRIYDIIKELSPQEHFSYEFMQSDNLDILTAESSDVIFAALQGADAAGDIKTLLDCKSPKAEIILITDKTHIDFSAETVNALTDIWTLPMTDEELKFRLRKWQSDYKTRVDCWEHGHFLEATINSVPNLVWYKDKDGIHEKVNDSFCEVVGKTKAQVEGRGHAYIWDVERDDPVCIESERIVMEKEETCVSEETIQTGEGERLLTTYKSPLYNWDGAVMGTVGVAIDVTKERAYANELIRKNQTLETLFTTMECGVMCHSRDGSRIISINRAALNILGYESQEELVADGFDMVAGTVIDEDKKMLYKKMNALERAGDNISVEYRVRHKDGSLLHVMGNVKLIEQNGELLYQRYLLDCTAQKLREAHERREDERHQMELLHALSIEYNLVCYFDLETGEGRVLRTSYCKNNILQSIFKDKLAMEECIGKYIDVGVYDGDKEMLREATNREHLEMELREKDMLSVNYRTTCCGEIRYFQMKAVRAGEWSENRGVVIGFCSVDEEIKSEMGKRAALEDALVQLNQANKAKTTFLSNMSHDIRTPMNAIIGFTALALSNIGNEEQVEEYLQKIETSGQHLLSLINDVLDMSHIESGKIHLDEQSCNLSELVRKLPNLVQTDVDMKGLNLQLDLSGIRNEEVCCDVLRLNQVLLNLLSNAVKYTERGGSISLRVLEKTGASDGFANYEFHIKDTGIGMSEEFVAHIFEPFERERNSTVSGIRGTGLGMAITKNIIDMMHGTIEVRSRQGVGTECTVCLSLRLNSETDTKKTEDKADTGAAKVRSGRILLAEDNELNQEIAVAILENAGFTVETADNGQIAVDMLKNSEVGYYSLILMDIQMPVMDGCEATRTIRSFDNKELASIPILAMTANAFEEDRQMALRTGMNDHIAKPIDIDKLMTTLDRVLEQGK